MPRRNTNPTTTSTRTRRVSHRWPTCPETGKLRLGERKDTHLALKSVRAQREAAVAAGRTSVRRECRAYRCTCCRGWHLTSIPNWV